MKKILLSAALLVGTFYASAQETRFGVKGGIDIASVTVDLGPLGKVTGSETGFFIGGFAEIGVNETFAIQPEILYVGIADFNMINVPILGKFKFAEKFSAMAGPSVVYLLDAEEDEFKVNIDVAAGYDITEDIDASVRYSIGFGDVKVSGLFIGVGYKF